jgi:hypothetical protein
MIAGGGDPGAAIGTAAEILEMNRWEKWIHCIKKSFDVMLHGLGNFQPIKI